MNIELSQRSGHLLQTASEWLAVEGESPELALTERGYLYLATPAGRSILHENWLLQTAHGAAIAWLEPDELAARFPGLTTEDLAAGTLGLAGKGWFDGPALHAALLRKAKHLGVRVRRADVQAFEPKGQGFSLRLAEGDRLDAEPQTNGVAERFNRTLKEQAIHGRVFRNLEEVRASVTEFKDRYNRHWRLEKLGFMSPLEARQSQAIRKAA